MLKSLLVFWSGCSSPLSPEWVPAEGWRLRPHPDRRWYQPDLRRHHSQHWCHRFPHQRWSGLCWRRHLWWLGQRVDVWGSWAGDEGHAPGAAHGWLWAALYRHPPPHADVKTVPSAQTQTTVRLQLTPSHRGNVQYLTNLSFTHQLLSLAHCLIPRAFLFFSRPQLRFLTSSSGKSLSLPHSHSAPFHTFLASAITVT